MSLWGIHANKTAGGTVAITSSGDVTGTGTAFTTQAKVGDYITVGQVDYLIRSIASDTSATVINGTVNGIDYGTSGAVTAVSSTTAYTLSEKPKYVTTAEGTTSTGKTGDSTKVYGVSAGSITLAGVALTATTGQITFTLDGELQFDLGQTVTVSGTNTGTGSITNGTYYITATNGTTNATLSATPGGSAITTTAGTTVGLTFVAKTASAAHTGVAHTGWVRTVVGSGGRSGRYQYETLVANKNVNQ